MIVSQTLIKSLFNNGSLRDYCPKKIYHKFIKQDYIDEPSSYQRKGLYFEQLCLGSTRDNNEITLTEKEEKSVVFKRIKEQALLCRNILLERGAVINKDTIQLEIECPYRNEIVLRGHIDLLTPLTKANGEDLGLTIVDTKLTGDVNSTFGEYCWGTPELVDSTQFYMYNHIFMCQLGKSTSFAYYVFDYKKYSEHKIIYKHLIDLEKATFMQSIDNTIEELNKNERYGWQPVVNKDNCRYCTLKTTCEAYINSTEYGTEVEI